MDKSAPLATKAASRLKLDPLTLGALRRIVKQWDDPDGELAARIQDIHPTHAVYAKAQNIASMLSDYLGGMKAMKPIVDIIAREEDLHCPSAPPMSPLTNSYFSNWALFDACHGPARETIGTTILRLAPILGIGPGLKHALELMQQSRMGIYVNRGNVNGRVLLEDLVSANAPVRAISPTGYLGEPDELWFVRLLPPVEDGAEEHLVLTTPYVLISPPASAWLEFFSRCLDLGRATLTDYELYMKYGPDPGFWNEYIFEAYVNHTKDTVFLKGIPDLPDTLPHSTLGNLAERAKAIGR